MATMVDEVVELDVFEARTAVRETLVRSGFTFEELRQQSVSHDFANVGAHLAWLVVQRLGNPTSA